MRINRTLRLPYNQFLHKHHKKTLIVLHHTAGASAASTYRWWVTDPKRIGTAYIISRSGRIYEVFPPECWAFHVAVKHHPRSARREIEHRSIGIELANAGWLLKRGEELYKFGRLTRANRFRCEPYKIERGLKNLTWRGQKYFEPYTTSQMLAVSDLVGYLCERFKIPRLMPRNPNAFKPGLIYAEGVISHANVRKDKTDVHPGFRWETLYREVGLRPIL